MENTIIENKLDKIKYIAFYLPQYHRIKENDEWWGDGFTEWTNVKKAKPLFSWHQQPKIPIGMGYYDLDKNHEQVMRWQIDLAKKYGVYGFCFYHYWFKGGKQLLEKPVERFLENKSLDIPFCISWANEPWTRTWDGKSKQVIMPQEYGDRDEWQKHFYYLLPYFKDSRYIQIDEKPLIVIYRPEHIGKLDEMLQCFLELANKEGLKGLYIVSQGSSYSNIKKKSKYIDTYILYEPGYTQREFSPYDKKWIRSLIGDPKLGLSLLAGTVKICCAKALKLPNGYFTTRICSYDLFWRHIVNRKYKDCNVLPGAFMDWDNSARRGNNGARVFKGATPDKFSYYMSKLAKKVSKETKQKIIFIDAWNEWGEGTYLEPDNIHEYGYLEGIRNSLNQ